MDPISEGDRPAPPAGRWRRRWKYACVGLLVLSFVMDRLGWAFEAALPEFKGQSWFLIVRGLIALGCLSSFTLAGLSGVGWVLSPRPRAANAEPDGSTPTS